MKKQLMSLGFVETKQGQFLLYPRSERDESVEFRVEFECDDDGKWSGIITCHDGYDFEEHWDGSDVAEWLEQMERKYWDV